MGSVYFPLAAEIWSASSSEVEQDLYWGMEGSKAPFCGAFWKDFSCCTFLWSQRGQLLSAVCRKLLKLKDPLHILVEGKLVHS